MSFIKNPLTDDELLRLAEQLAPLIIPAAIKADTTKEADAIDEDELPPGMGVVNGEVVYTDPAVKVADEVIGKALKSLPMGTATYVGRRGTTVVNHSKESIDAVESWKKRRNQWQTRSKL